MKSKAVVFPRANQVQIQTVNCPDPGPDDVVVRITHSWISNGTEGSYLRGERIEGDTAYREGDPIPFPIVAGYQKIGVVEWVGAQIQDLSVGQIVFAALGQVNGMFEPHGGHVSPSVCKRNQIWKLPAGVDPIAFAGLVLTQVGYNCGTRFPLTPGERAVVLGDGMVGHWAAQTLAWRGVDVCMVGRHDWRLNLFETGAGKHVINSRQTDWVDAVRCLDSRPLSLVVDTVGSIQDVEASLCLIRHQGSIVSAGFYGTQDRLSLQPLRHGEKAVCMVAGWKQPRMDQTLALIASGALQTLPLITHRFAVDDAAKAWDLIKTKREPVLGVILEWGK
jgi:2-desacetyl-2-hydroxyethyl bacteriochlorophyllide A dehydrogenase